MSTSDRSVPLPPRWRWGLSALVMLLAVAVFAAVDYIRFTQQSLAINGDDAIIEIRPGSGFSAIVAQMQSRGWTGRPLWWRVLGMRSGMLSTLKAGEYQMDVGMRPAQVLEKLSSGQVIQYAFTIVEGWTVKQLVNQLQEAPALTNTLSGQVDGLADRLGLDEPLEGWFLPETYQYPRGTTDVELLLRAHAAMQAALSSAWEERAPDLQIKTPYEALVLASIIERETGVVSERETISGVFHRRLARNMKLQTDPTVIYGMGERYDGRIRSADLREDTPYNTYVHRGLPPTPIALPGLAAIVAACHPEPGDSLYFVSKGDGSHQFSATLEEHNRAVDIYIRNRP